MMPALAPVVRLLLDAAGAGDGVGVEVELPAQQPLWQPEGPSVQLGAVSWSLLDRLGTY